MLKLEQTIPGQTWSTFDWNSVTYDGCIVDLGCWSWDWSTYWFGMKRVIGIDPFEQTVPNGAELFSGVLGDKDCKVGMDKPGGHEITGTINLSSFENGEYEMLSWKSFCKKFEIDNVSILKMNIEGSEYSFLNSLDNNDFSKINQIIVSFHDWLNPDLKESTRLSIELLKQKGYVVISTYFPYGWYLCVKSEFVNSNYMDRWIF